MFETEKTPRGVVRCVAFGNLIAITHTNEATEARQMIIREAGRSMDFYWNRNKQWPFAGARLGADLGATERFPTSYAVDPVPKPARAPP